MKYKIEKDILITRPRHYTKNFDDNKYPLKDMKVGESFFVKCNSRAQISSVRLDISNFYRKWIKYNLRYDYKISMRALENGVRMWRTE